MPSKAVTYTMDIVFAAMFEQQQAAEQKITDDREALVKAIRGVVERRSKAKIEKLGLTFVRVVSDVSLWWGNRTPPTIARSYSVEVVCEEADVTIDIGIPAGTVNRFQTRANRLFGQKPVVHHVAKKSFRRGDVIANLLKENPKTVDKILNEFAKILPELAT